MSTGYKFRRGGVLIALAAAGALLTAAAPAPSTHGAQAMDRQLSTVAGWLQPKKGQAPGAAPGGIDPGFWAAFVPRTTR